MLIVISEPGFTKWEQKNLKEFEDSKFPSRHPALVFIEDFAKRKPSGLWMLVDNGGSTALRSSFEKNHPSITIIVNDYTSFSIIWQTFLASSNYDMIGRLNLKREIVRNH